MHPALPRIAVGVVVAGLVGTLMIPHVAPHAMTMGTMDAMMGVDRYQDRGRCDFWVVNMSFPAERIEREFPCGFHWDWSTRDDRGAYIQEALLDHERGAIFEVPNMERGRMEEWYHVDGHMLTDDALAFTTVDGAGVLMPPPGSSGNLTIGWVESNGTQDGEERLVHARNATEDGSATIRGIDTVRWTSSFRREPATWHGYDVHLSERVAMWSDPKTGWILKMHRHVVVEMTPSQMAAAAGHDAPSTGSDPRPVMELDYRSVPEGVDRHVDQDRTFRAMMTPVHGWRTGALALAAAAAVLAVPVAVWTVRREAG